ncbi:OmpA family protein [Parendozoicomonas haliclonae]|uniref:Putative lipoprotein YiaD n=1 Tax=Parendozoicomonas haliclonae TaxID=1960125 RepID=A0A1X7ASJ2_9GAMM|nr:OmpA family protein [Parendozoicomonas haliclonae]SMA50387.1 putative lipoprotein YiaD precursor [Parendozoicomonas haliclonae]
MKKLVAICLAGAVLAGCQSTNPYTGEQQTAKSTKYAGIGVLAGALVGAAANGKDGALAGAALGGLAGAGYGAYADKQEAALRAELQGTGVQVARYGDDIKLIMPGNITFDSSDAAIKSGFYRVLGSVATVMKQYDENAIVIVGHTDSTGNEQKTNMPLSNERAMSVARYLEGQGVASARITAYGVGSSEPVASNTSPAGREQNRRVEIDLKPVVR